MFTPRYLKLAKHLLHAAHKLEKYRRDILPAKDHAELLDSIRVLETVLAGKRNRQQIGSACEALDATCTRIAPPPKDSGWRENCEVILVAIAIAVGVRAYFLQPFKIPTGSMQPTLNGIVGVPQPGAAPNLVRQALEYVVLGRNYIDFVSATDDNQVLEMREVKRLHFFIFSQLRCTDGLHTVYAPSATLVQHFGVRPGRTYRRGEVIARGYIDTGDQVFVDKMSYHFRAPARSDVFVFKTTGIRRIEETINRAFGSQFYIKRLVGLPGDRLRVDPPNMFVNGEEVREPMMRRVMEAKNGYRGYSNNSESGGRIGPRFTYLGAPDDVFAVPSRAYFAMGDNSFNSSDSRHWGIVPEKNVVGRGLLVYWPFTRHWGLIR